MANFWDMAFTFVLEDLNEPLKPIRRTCAVAAAAPDTRQRKKRKRETAKRRPVSPEEPVGKVARWRFDPEKSPWWRLVRARGVRNEGTRAYNKFRKKFRLPLTTVEELVQEAQGVTGGGVTGGGVMGRVCTAYGIGQACRRRNDAAPCEHAHDSFQQKTPREPTSVPLLSVLFLCGIF